MSNLEQLKEQATELGISFKANATEATLKKLINEHEKQQEALVHQALELDNLKLTHVIITPNDPSRLQQQGEIFGGGNSVLGTITRFVPFGENWLIENILYKHIRDKQYQYFKVHQKDGKEFVESKLLPAYNIQVLPLPTEKEIKELAQAQLARNSVE